jgi:hypothetical protein
MIAKDFATSCGGETTPGTPRFSVIPITEQPALEERSCGVCVVISAECLGEVAVTVRASGPA